MHLWLIGGMELKDAMHLTHGRSESGVDRIVREVSVLHHVPEHVDPETIDSARQPEAQHILHCLLNGRIAPVKSRLLLQEGVVIILFGSLVPFPGRAAEIADPVIGRSAAESRIAPDVPVATRIVPRRSALNKPGVPVRAVVRYEVQQQLQTARSEEHTYELQSLMRISYAVFCLKKKNHH